MTTKPDTSAMTARGDRIDVDALAQEIRRVDGDNSLGAGALAEKIVAYLAAASHADAVPVGEIEKAVELIDEGLGILVSLIGNVTRHGNYSPESTCLFLDQAGQCFRASRTALKGASHAE